MKVRRSLFVVLVSLLLVLLAVGLAQAQGQSGADAPPTGAAPAAIQAGLGTSFTYQGQLMQDGAPVNDKCDFRFTLYDAATGGSPVGSAVERLMVSVGSGLFMVPDLDFGASAFAGSMRWLQVEVRCPVGAGSYTVVGDRQALTATPYALYATTAASATTAGSAPWSGLAGVPGGFADGVDNDALGGLSCGSGQVAKWNGTAWACAMVWGLTGNASTTPGTHFLGTTDGQALEFKVNGQRALRLEPSTSSPNVIGGSSANAVASGSYGATIAGGGGTTTDCGSAGGRSCRNYVDGYYGTVGGGSANVAGSPFLSGSTVGGGYANTASGPYATVGGGYANTASEADATVSGGDNNLASGWYATVGGGSANTASASGATVPGGTNNTAAGMDSFAAGHRAGANHMGSFVWGDSTDADFASTANGQFAIRAGGGVKVVRGQSTFASTSAALQVEQASTTGQAVYATSPGTSQQGAAVYAEATNTTGGIAVWARAQGSDSTMVLEQSAGAGDFVRFFQSSPSDLRFRVTASGEVYADGAFHAGGADFAELLPAETGLAPGDVLVIGPDGMLTLSSEPYARTVAGVYSTKPGLIGGTADASLPDEACKVPLAVIGVVPTKVTAENGAIRPGDLLTTSATPGHAMRCEGVERCFGRTFGKALEGLAAGTGVIEALVTLQ